ncbi:MAG TPA: glutaminyl-peptide cyclotransferase [Phototrophicaceae bacterium]|nr:glutaminyl-peptide cyclotransferase [Phototrophicaceae bacterium]
MKLLRMIPAVIAGSLLVISLTGCEAVLSLVQSASDAASVTTQAEATAIVEPQILVPQILEVYPHDTGAFTEGLAYIPGDTADGGNRLIQLTWKNQIAFVYNPDVDPLTFVQTGMLTYEGEGWGICYDPLNDALYMSNGSSSIFERDPDTMELIQEIPVTLQGQPVTMLNELECVGDKIYANVWLTNGIVEIDKASGNILNVIDASGLLTEEEYAALSSDGVLNGIAYNTQTDNFLITGKLFPKIFEVQFVSPDE